MREGCQPMHPPPCLVTSSSHHRGSLSNHEAGVLQGREPSICQAEQGSPPQPVASGPGLAPLRSAHKWQGSSGSRAKQGGCWAGLGVASQEEPELASGITWRQSSSEEFFERRIK